jgi:hypothetical protein
MIAPLVTPLETFIQSLAVRDWDALESAFHPAVRFRALVPAGLREANTRTEARRYYEKWFSDVQQFEMVGHAVMPVSERRQITYRLHFIEEGAPKVCEQHVFVTLGEMGIEKFDLVCSGFLPRTA